MTRRISTITEALRFGPTQANWSQARELMGRGRPDSLLSNEHRAEVIRHTKYHLEVGNLRTRSAARNRAKARAEAQAAVAGLGLVGNGK